MSAPSALPTSDPMVHPHACATTQLRILDKLLGQEVELHNVTKSMLAQSQSCCKAWESACNSSHSELYHAQVRLSTVERRAQDLIRENQRLNLIINHLVRTNFALNLSLIG
jgi:hypothetical protein